MDFGSSVGACESLCDMGCSTSIFGAQYHQRLNRQKNGSMMLRALLSALRHLLGRKGIAIISPSSRLHTTWRQIGWVKTILPVDSLQYILPPLTELTTINHINSLGIQSQIYAASSSPYRSGMLPPLHLLESAWWDKDSTCQRIQW